MSSQKGSNVDVMIVNGHKHGCHPAPTCTSPVVTYDDPPAEVPPALGGAPVIPEEGKVPVYLTFAQLGYIIKQNAQIIYLLQLLVQGLNPASLQSEVPPPDPE